IFRKVSFRVAPPLVLLYFIAFLDRVNIGFASLAMNRDLHIDDTTYGLAAGIFFLGYLLFAVPSNYMLVRVGALRWIAALMVTWGLVSGGMAFVHGPRMYLLLRFALGAAEAGFFPGIVFYLTQWLPGSARAAILAMFYFAIPLSSVVGSPVSAWLMQMNGWHGLAGWQWLFLLEALPAVIFGAAVPWMLHADVKTSRWLTAGEKQSLLQAIETESASVTPTGGEASRRLPTGLLPLAAAYFMLMIGLYELGFWTPRLLSSHGVSLRLLGWVNAIPYASGGIGMLLWSRWSDLRRERRWTLFASFAAAGAGFAGTALAPTASVAALTLSLAAFGVFASMAVFWAASSQRMAAGTAALGIAVINSVGNVGGFLGPYATGWLLGRTHNYSAGLFASAAALLLGACIVLAAFAPRESRA
ncbi:MAG: MFS transporter, partial [Janthinobacterium lividum]